MCRRLVSNLYVLYVLISLNNLLLSNALALSLVDGDLLRNWIKRVVQKERLKGVWCLDVVAVGSSTYL